jgi:hypothetical protein
MLFVSYSHKDHKLAEKLASTLEEKGYPSWMDRRRIHVGDRWSMEIEKGMNQSTAIVAIISASAVRPESYVRKELSRAEVLGKPIYPIVVEQIPVQDMPMEIVNLHQIFSFGNFDDGINALLKTLQPPEQGRCDVEVPQDLLERLPPESLEYAMMSRFPLAQKIIVKAEITDGYSGSKVYFVDAAFRNSTLPPSSHFLKINNAFSDEPRRLFEMAYKSRLKTHMPVLSDATEWDEKNNRIGLLYGIGAAPGGYASLDDILGSNLGEASRVIGKVCDTLVEWNDRGTHTKAANILELLNNAFCQSLHPESRAERLNMDSTSSVFYRGLKLLNLTENTPLIDLETRHGLPNPLSYLADKTLWGDVARTNLSYPSGNIHGDLHVRNIQAVYKTRDKMSMEVLLIDFDTYDPDNLIFMDFAFLEISIIGRLFNLNQEIKSRKTFHELERLSAYLAKGLDLTDEIPNLNVLSVGTWVLLRRLRETVAEIANWNRDYDTAFWIARMAAGLQLVRKRRPSHQERLFALLVASDSLSHILSSDEGIELPRGRAANLEWTIG